MCKPARELLGCLLLMLFQLILGELRLAFELAYLEQNVAGTIQMAIKRIDAVVRGNCLAVGQGDDSFMLGKVDASRCNLSTMLEGSSPLSRLVKLRPIRAGRTTFKSASPAELI